MTRRQMLFTLALVPVRDSMHVTGEVGEQEGYYNLREPEVAILPKPDSELAEWLKAHCGQRVVVTFRERRILEG